MPNSAALIGPQVMQFSVHAKLSEARRHYNAEWHTTKTKVLQEHSFLWITISDSRCSCHYPERSAVMMHAHFKIALQHLLNTVNDQCNICAMHCFHMHCRKPRNCLEGMLAVLSFQVPETLPIFTFVMH